MDTNPVYLIVTTILAIVGSYYTIRDFYLRRQKAPSEKDANIASAVSNLSSALGLTSNELVESLTEAAKLRDDLKAERLLTEKRILETAEHRIRQEKQINDLKAQIEKLNRDYAQETQKLKDEIRILRGQVEESEKRYNAAKLIIERLVEALKHENITLPDLDLSNLTDSVRNWTWPTKPNE